MSRKRRKNKTLHTEYLRVYHEVLKYEEVIDINIDFIFQTFLKIVAQVREKVDLTIPPGQREITNMKELVLDELSLLAEYKR